MSRAFVKEDVELPERSGRARSPSGLPPGALNYMTASGARRLRERLANLRNSGTDNTGQIAHLERVLASVTVVEPPAVLPDTVALGATVEVRAPDGKLETYRIVGVDEVEFEPNALTWISPLGKALIGAAVGEHIRLEGDKRSMTIIKIDYEDLAN